MATNTTESVVCGRKDYFACSPDITIDGCYPIGYVCGERTCHLPGWDENLSLTEPVRPCPNFEGYRACHEDTGGEQSSLSPFMRRLSVRLILNRELLPSQLCLPFDPASSSAALSLARLTTHAERGAGSSSTIVTDTSPDAMGRDNPPISLPSPGAQAGTRNSGLSQGAQIAVIVSTTIIVLLIAIGIYVVIRRHRRRSRRDKSPEESPHVMDDEKEAQLELGSNDHFPWEMPADNGTMELSHHREAWELEDTQYTPELPAYHGVSEVHVKRHESEKNE